MILNYINALQGLDIICLDVHKKISITNTMIICTGTSNRHVIAISQNILIQLHTIGVKLYGVEGMNIGEWVLIDLKDTIVHIMTKKLAYYMH